MSTTNRPPIRVTARTSRLPVTLSGSRSGTPASSVVTSAATIVSTATSGPASSSRHPGSTKRPRAGARRFERLSAWASRDIPAANQATSPVRRRRLGRVAVAFAGPVDVSRRSGRLTGNRWRRRAPAGNVGRASMRRERDRSESDDERIAPAPQAPAPAAPEVARMLSLQQGAGNAAVSRMVLARQVPPVAPPAPATVHHTQGGARRDDAGGLRHVRRATRRTGRRSRAARRDAADAGGLQAQAAPPARVRARGRRRPSADPGRLRRHDGPGPRSRPASTRAVRNELRSLRPRRRADRR